MWRFVLAVFFVCLLNSPCDAAKVTKREAYQSRLDELLARKISKFVPPFPTNETDGLVPVRVNFQMHRVISLKSDSATLKVSGKIRVSWEDDRYSWVKKQPSDPNSVLLPVKSIWVPELALDTSADFRIDDVSSILVRHDGRAVIERTVQLDVACEVDVHYFPRDVQRCSLVFVPLLTHREIIKPVPHHGLGLDQLATLGEEWSLLACQRSVAERTVYDGAGDPVTLDAYVVSVLLLRNSAFYVLTIILPVAMLTLVTHVPFFLPPSQCGPKIVIPITAYLSFNIYMLLIEKTLPKSSEIPLLGRTVAVFMAMCVFTELMQAISVKFYSCRLKRIPKCLHILYFRVFSVISCYRTCHGAVALDSCEESLAAVPVDKSQLIQKNWFSMGRINDRIGFIIVAIVSSIAFIYLVASCYTAPMVPESYALITS